MIKGSPLVILKELSVGFGYGLWFSRHHLIHSFIIIPLGIVILFTILYGLNVLLSDELKIQFPASVLGMLINLIALCVLDAVASLKDSSQKPIAMLGNASWWMLEKYLMIIKPSMNFSLKWINVFFIPSFVVLPLSDHITFIECLKIAGVFVVGGAALMIFDVYSIILLKKLLYALSVLKVDDKYGSSTGAHLIPKESGESPNDDSEMNGLPFLNVNHSYISAINDITTIDLTQLRSVKTAPEHKSRPYNCSNNSIGMDVVEEDNLRRFSTSPNILQEQPSEATSDTHMSLRTSFSQADESKDPIAHLSGISRSTTVFISNYIDWFLFFAMFVVSLPLYYVSSIHIMLFYHLSLTVLSYYVALLIPIKVPHLRKFAHPILISTVLILFICFIGSLIYHKGVPQGFLQDLQFYKTGKTYLRLFNNKAMYNNGEIIPEFHRNFTAVPLWPGCGDILSSLMDISIVSLSLPMFTHRRDFKNNFWVLMPPILASMALTFFCYPLVCYHIGISPERSIGFIGRSVTLALGTPLIGALGGSVSLMAVCTILSGILGVLVGDSFFSLLRISSDDFVTRGVTLGINCGAIATAHLLNVDPRAASMSSLSFSTFGTIMIILASINAVRELIRSWVGL
ncbi:hypothetical protein CJJ07_001831 [Candidozyma auris]|nr:hypothetical protein CJJ07_001831 [[Candida] auris]